VVMDDLSSPVWIKTTVDAHSTPMMRLRDDAGREILWLLQCLTPLVKDGGGLDGSPMRSDGLEKNLEFGVASCNFQDIWGFSCNLMGCSVLFVNASPCFEKSTGSVV
jgi:hypothetical protein